VYARDAPKPPWEGGGLRFASVRGLATKMSAGAGVTEAWRRVSHRAAAILGTGFGDRFLPLDRAGWRDASDVFPAGLAGKQTAGDETDRRPRGPRRRPRARVPCSARRLPGTCSSRSGDEYPSPPKQVCSTASEQEEAPESQRVSGHDPLQVGLGEVKVAAHRRQRDVDDLARSMIVMKNATASTANARQR
jgi:hypothetical protein